MNLEELNLNRFLYKDNSALPSNAIDTTLYNQTQNNQGGNNSSGDSGSPSSSQIPANNLAPGTVVSACLIQSSSQTYRVEISPKDNSLTAYNNAGKKTVIINPTGVYADFLFVNQGVIETVIIENAQIDNLVVTNLFDFKGTLQPVQFYAEVNGLAGTFLSAPPGWSIVKNAVGDYTITHNLNTASYFAFFTGEGLFVIFNMNPITTTTLRVTVQDDAGVATDAVFMINVAAFI